jgi:hypothetical protein
LASKAFRGSVHITVFISITCEVISRMALIGKNALLRL